jgi:hypothetical protein
MLLRRFSGHTDRPLIQQFSSQLDQLEFPKGCMNAFMSLDTLEFKYSKSSGPGGQHVNKGT